MSWLKIADKHPASYTLHMLQGRVGAMITMLEDIPDTENIRAILEQAVQALLERYKKEEGAKEGSVVDFQELERSDANEGNSKEFEEENVVDRKKRDGVDAGPASTVPGSRAENSPTIPTGIV